MPTPVNCTASASVQSKASSNAGNMGAKASGPKPWEKVAKEALVIHTAFQNGLQFRGSWGSSEGCGIRTTRLDPLTK